MKSINKNNWARITDNHWVHPDLGHIKYFNGWEAYPKAYLGTNIHKTFDDFNKAVEYMESFTY